MVLPSGAVPRSIVIDTSGIRQRCASSISPAAADGSSVVAAALRSLWATNVTVGCAGSPEETPISALFNTHPIAPTTTSAPTVPTIAARRPAAAVDAG
jgi:hypothetical protein